MTDNKMTIARTPSIVPPAMQIEDYPVTQGDIDKLKATYGEVPEDLSIKENYAFVQSAIRAIKPVRTGVEKLRKYRNQGAQDFIKQNNLVAKWLTEQLVAIESPHATIKKEYDVQVEIEKKRAQQAETARVENITDRITAINEAVADNISSTANEVLNTLADLQEIRAKGLLWAEELRDKAEKATNNSIAGLEELLKLKTQQEELAAKQAQEEKERKEKEEEQRKKDDKDRRVEKEKLDKEKEELRLEKEKLKKAQDEQNEKLEADREEIRIEKERLKKEKDDLKRAKEEPVRVEIPQEKELPVLVEKLEKRAVYSDEWRATAKAMNDMIGNKLTTENLLNKIIAMEIETLTYTEGQND